MEQEVVGDSFLAFALSVMCRYCAMTIYNRVVSGVGDLMKVDLS